MGTENTCSTGSSCAGRLCGVIFKLILVGLLTCIASSLWEIEKSVARMVPAAARP
jgi:hypothetical protein